MIREHTVMEILRLEVPGPHVEKPWLTYPYYRQQWAPSPKRHGRGDSGLEGPDPGPQSPIQSRLGSSTQNSTNALQFNPGKRRVTAKPKE